MKKNTLSREVYEKLEMQDLIVFAIYSVIKSKETCTYERLVAESFHRFPEIFRFKRYPQWPDSLKFDRPLRTLREKGFIVGTVRDHFDLTEFGRAKAKQIEYVLLGKTTADLSRKSKSAGRSLDDKLIEYVRESELFKQYSKSGANFTISDSEFRRLLRCTLETPERVLKQNLEYYKNVARSYSEVDIAQFLQACEKQFFKRGV